MKQTITIIVLATVSLGLLAYILYGNIGGNTVSPETAKTKAESFINDYLLQDGIDIVLGDITEESNLYKMPITFPDGVSVDAYITKDGELFFPEGINIDEAIEQIQNTAIPEPQGELQVEILEEGEGEAIVESGDSITVEYTGLLTDNTEFDAGSITFTIGQGEVIAGWDQGLLGMKVGEIRKLTIPSDLGYGPYGSGPIPPNATLIFNAKLVSIN